MSEWEQRPGESWADYNARTSAKCGAAIDDMRRRVTTTPAAMLGEAFEYIRKARRIVAEMEGRALTPQDAADLGVANLKGAEMGAIVERVRSTWSQPARTVTPTRDEWVREHGGPLNDDCWTVGIGAIPHKLGGMPEACLTCAAKVAEDRTRTPRDPSPGAGAPVSTILVEEASKYVTCPKCGKGWLLADRSTVPDSHLRTCTLAPSPRDGT